MLTACSGIVCKSIILLFPILSINSIIDYVINNFDFSVRLFCGWWLLVSNIWSYSLYISNLNYSVGRSDNEDFGLNGKQSMHANLQRLNSIIFPVFHVRTAPGGVQTWAMWKAEWNADMKLCRNSSFIYFHLYGLSLSLFL